MSDLVGELREAHLGSAGASINNGCAGCGCDANLFSEAADEIERLQEVLRTIAFRAQDAKRLCEEGAPVSAYNLASGILGQIGGDVPALTAKSR